MKQLPFLDVLNIRLERSITSVYRKSTVARPLQNYNSYISLTCNKGLIKTLIDRTFCFNNTWDGFQLDLKRLHFTKKRIPT